MINLKESLEKHKESVEEIKEYFADAGGKPADPSGEIYDYTDKFWSLTGSRNDVSWAKSKSFLVKQDDEEFYCEEICGTSLWEKKEFTMITFNDSCGHGEYTMIFNNSKKVAEEEIFTEIVKENFGGKILFEVEISIEDSKICFVLAEDEEDAERIALDSHDYTDMDNSFRADVLETVKSLPDEADEDEEVYSRGERRVRNIYDFIEVIKNEGIEHDSPGQLYLDLGLD